MICLFISKLTSAASSPFLICAGGSSRSCDCGAKAERDATQLKFDKLVGQKWYSSHEAELKSQLGEARREKRFALQQVAAAERRMAEVAQKAAEEGEEVAGEVRLREEDPSPHNGG